MLLMIVMLTSRCLGTCADQPGRVQRIGPFRSTGGYDWWQFAWGDALKYLHGKADGVRRGIKGHFAGVVDKDGVPLGLPPFHAHHLHIAPSWTNTTQVRVTRDPT